MRAVYKIFLSVLIIIFSTLPFSIINDFSLHKLHISELPDSDAGVVPDTFAMRFSRV